MKFNDFIITDIGFSNVNAAVINEKDITFKKLVTGTGSWDVSEIPGAKELKEPKQEILISKVEILDDKTVRCLATISNTGITESYCIKEVGVYIESDGRETLYSISTAKDEIEMPLESEVGMYQINFNFYQKISTGDVNIRVANEAFVAAKDFEVLQKDVDELKNEINIKIGNVKEDSVLTGYSVLDISCNANEYVAIISSGQGTKTYRSSDGGAWTDTGISGYSFVNYGYNTYVFSTKDSNKIAYWQGTGSAEEIKDPFQFTALNTKAWSDVQFIFGDKIVRVGLSPVVPCELLEFTPYDSILDLDRNGDFFYGCSQNIVVKYSGLLYYGNITQQILFEDSGETFSSIVCHNDRAYVSTRSGKIISVEDNGSHVEAASGFEPGENKLLYKDGFFLLQTQHNIYASSDCIRWKTIITTDGTMNGIKALDGQFVAYGDQGIKYFTIERSLRDQVSELNSALSSKFECGSVSITGKSDGWVFIPVTYSYPHKTIPIVVASHASADVAQIPCTTRYQSVSGFEIGLYKSTAQTTFNWIAIEP